MIAVRGSPTISITATAPRPLKHSCMEPQNSESTRQDIMISKGIHNTINDNTVQYNDGDEYGYHIRMPSRIDHNSVTIIIHPASDRHC